MKRMDLIFTFARLPLDIIALLSAALTAYGIRMSPYFSTIRKVNVGIDLNEYIIASIIMTAVWIAVFATFGLYTSAHHRKFSKELHKIISATSAGFAIIAIIIFLRGELFNSRFIVLAAWLLAIVFVTLGRIAVRSIQYNLYKRGVGLSSLVLIGNTNTAQNLKEEYKKNPRLGIAIYKTFSTWNSETENNVLKLVKQKKIDGMISCNIANEESSLAMLAFAQEHHLSFRYTANLFAVAAPKREISIIETTPVIEIKRTPLDGWGRISKRIFDVVFSLIFITVFSPLYLLVALTIFLETGRPILFKNERVGERGSLFSVYKFRTMHQKFSIGEQFSHSSEALAFEKELIEKQSKKGAVYKIKDDPRITPLGKILRKFSLDELPNFFNVLKGDMSIVGPRPHQEREVQNYEKHHKVVLSIKPGITGLAQISGRSDLIFDEEAKLDAFYIEHWSLTMDLFIIIKTPLVILSKKGATV